MKKQAPRRKWQKNPFAINIALNNVALVKDAGADNTRLRLVAHDAVDTLRRGLATRGHLQMIVETSNMAYVLATVFDFGKDWIPEIIQAQEAIQAISVRGVELGRYVARGPELVALNLLLEIHDAQLDACSVQTLGKAVDYILRRIASNDVQVLPTIKEAA